jgi:hypothetical protein
MGITKNAVSDYGLDNTGVVDIIPTVSGTMRTEATGQDFATITYPAGTYLVDSFGGNGGNYVKAHHADRHRSRQRSKRSDSNSATGRH